MLLAFLVGKNRTKVEEKSIVKFQINFFTWYIRIQVKSAVFLRFYLHILYIIKLLPMHSAVSILF